MTSSLLLNSVAVLALASVATPVTAQVGGSGERTAGAVGHDCKQNSTCAIVTHLNAVVPLNADVEPNNMIYQSTLGGQAGDVTLRPVGIGNFPDWAAMYMAVPVIDFSHRNVTYEALFFNRSSSRPRIASLQVPYSTPRKSKTYTTSSGYVSISSTGKACKDDGCAIRQTVRAYVPKNAMGVSLHYLTTAANGPGDDDLPLHSVEAGKLDCWATFQPAVENSNVGPTTKAYESLFLNTSSNRTRYAVLLVTYSLP